MCREPKPRVGGFAETENPFLDPPKANIIETEQRYRLGPK
jgi:hypothetical protein